MVPSGSGSIGISSGDAPPLLNLVESKSTIHTSSGSLKGKYENQYLHLLRGKPPSSHLKFFLYMRNDAGIPITYGVGASNNCSAQLIHVGRSGITGNMYSSG